MSGGRAGHGQGPVEAVVESITIHPHEVTPLPGTKVGVLWRGEEPVTVRRGGHGIWDVSPLVRPGEVLGFVVLLDRPELPAWPLVEVGRREVYRNWTGCG